MAHSQSGPPSLWVGGWVNYSYHDLAGSPSLYRSSVRIPQAQYRRSGMGGVGAVPIVAPTRHGDRQGTASPLALYTRANLSGLSSLSSQPAGSTNPANLLASETRTCKHDGLGATRRLAGVNKTFPGCSDAYILMSRVIELLILSDTVRLENIEKAKRPERGEGCHRPMTILCRHRNSSIANRQLSPSAHIA